MDEVETMVGEDAMSSSIIPFPCYRVTRKYTARRTVWFVDRSGKFGPLVDRRRLDASDLPLSRPCLFLTLLQSEVAKFVCKCTGTFRKRTRSIAS